MKAENMILIYLTKDQAQGLLDLIDDLHEQHSKGEPPDIGLLLQLADAINDALTVEK